MNIKFKTLKPGSMLIYKQHNIFKRLLYKLLKKELPYNKIVMFLNSIDIMDTFPKNSSTLLAIPKRFYNKEDITRLTLAIANSQYLDADTYSVEFNNNTRCELIEILNSVRKNTCNVNDTIADIANNKNYNVKRIAEETNWDVCLY